MVKASSGPCSRENGYRGGVLHRPVPMHGWGQHGGPGGSQPAAWTDPVGPCRPVRSWACLTKSSSFLHVPYSPYIIGTMNQATSSTPNLQLHHNFR